MKDIQEKIQLFCFHHNMIASPEHRLLDVVSELGEAAKEVLKATDYGRKEFSVTDDFADEMGDALFSLIACANAAHIDLDSALDRVLKKYDKRSAKGDIGSDR